MGRNLIIEDINEAVEDRFYMVGDARDHLFRQEARCQHYIDMLERGSVTWNAVRGYLREDYAAATRDLEEWVRILESHADYLKFPYPANSKKVGRVVALLPEGVA